MRDLTAGQLAALTGEATRPTFLVSIRFAGSGKLSTNGDVVVTDTTYLGEDIGIDAMEDWTRATIRLRPTVERVSYALTSAWRGSSARIYLLPRPLVEGTYTGDDLVLLLDGVLVGATLGEQLELTVLHRSIVGQWSPRIRIAKPFCNHLPQPGTVLTWQGDVYTLEAR